MLDQFNVRYASVVGTMTQNQNRVSSDTSYCTNFINQARAIMEPLGGLGITSALEGLDTFKNSADLLAELANHFMEAIKQSTIQLESEEIDIARWFDIYAQRNEREV